jgi:replicative DNA helicase
MTYDYDALDDDLDEPPRRQAAPRRRKGPPDGGWCPESLSSGEFFARDYRPAWLVKRLLVARQPAVIGGPKKSLKTSLLIDLALSLATGRPFLGIFDVYRPCRVLFVSGESGRHAVQETARRVAAARGIDPAQADVAWCFELPQLANAEHLDDLGNFVLGMTADVVILDPLYLALLTGPAAAEVNAGNLYHMGPLLLGVSRVCLESGATPVLAHHAKRSRVTAADEPLDLDDLAFSGIAEFARQWLLVSRREPFDPDARVQHRLWLAAGGSEGQGGLWALDVAEGRLGDDFAGRVWDVDVRPGADARKESAGQQREAQDQARADRLGARVRADGTKVLVALDALAGPDGVAGQRAVRDRCRLNDAAFGRAVQALAAEGTVVECDHTVMMGKGKSAGRVCKGVRRAPRGTNGTNGTEGVRPISPKGRGGEGD